jgi:type IV secretory pathway TraG/TraD family ATPase VirD4
MFSVPSTLNIFQQPAVRRMISSSKPTFDFEMLQAGKILIVDFPVLVYQQQARLVQLVLKHCFMLCQSRRVVGPNARPVLLAVDECQHLVDLEHDGKFLTTARSSCTVVIYATQSISNYLSMTSGSNAESRTHAMLANLQNQLFCQTTDIKTVEYAQALLGKRRTFYMNNNTQRSGQDWFGQSLGLNQDTGTSAGFSEQLAPLIEADDLHNLARGGPEYDFTVETLVYSSGKSFASTNAPFMIARFRQRPLTS